MTADRINVAWLHAFVASPYVSTPLKTELLALLDAVEAAHALISDDDTVGLVQLVEPLRIALARFDFGGADA